ncbi:MAG: glycerol-3-phosphate dehydrogenase subunit GlpB [Magnetococcales bacterium]|nr:glycerol-3-phosphate dehydrogenase subunit GlpB [Magnetococcales bacterium]
MIRETRSIQTQLAIVGTGLGGLAAGIFAKYRGIKSAQVGHTGAITYTTGYFDLLGGLLGEQILDPWQGLSSLKKHYPKHPLVRIAKEDIHKALNLFNKELNNMGIGYSEPGNTNLMALLPSGVCKPTISVPLTMLAGVKAKEAKSPTLLIDFVGLQGFSAVEFVANLKKSWPLLTAQRIAFPDMIEGQQVFPEVMARALEVPSTRQKLAETIKPFIGNAKYLGLPSILGINKPDLIHNNMEELLGVKVFEIPSIPPSVPGMRLRELFEQKFVDKNVTLIPQHKVEHIELNDDGAKLFFKDPFGDIEISCKATILASGRFLSGGLKAEQQNIVETLLNIPVTQPTGRDDWYQEKYFDPKGHNINQVGVEIDNNFRPLNTKGEPINRRLFAAGTIIAHQDWVRQRCGAGVSLSTAYQAVKYAAKVLD